MNFLPDGIWPVMLTPFDDSGNIDFDGLKDLIDFYLGNNVCGLFATCGSSEISMLEPREIIALCRATVQHTDGRVPIVAGLPQFNSIAEQADFISRVMDEGVNCGVIMACYMAAEDHGDNFWKAQIQKLLNLTGNIPLGIYECPAPYHRLLSPETLQWVAQTGRFVFHKDTCCNADTIRTKLEYCNGTDLSFYNAHTASLIDSLHAGANGYCGVGANFYPELYVWLLENYKTDPILSGEILNFLVESETVFGSHYPAFAKMFLKMRDVSIGTRCRVKVREYTEENTQKLESLFNMANKYIDICTSRSFA